MLLTYMSLKVHSFIIASILLYVLTASLPTHSCAVILMSYMLPSAIQPSVQIGWFNFLVYYANVTCRIISNFCQTLMAMFLHVQKPYKDQMFKDKMFYSIWASVIINPLVWCFKEKHDEVIIVLNLIYVSGNNI